jgi:DNA topoisomerase-2
MNKLKLIKPVTENYTCIDENLKIFQAENIIDVFNRYYDVKLAYIEKRRLFTIDKLTKLNEINNSKKIFIESYIKGKIKINNVKKEDIVASLEKVKDIVKVDDSYDYLLKMPLYSLTFEKLQELNNTIEDINNTINELKNSTPQKIWLGDLNALKL